MAAGLDPNTGNARGERPTWVCAVEGSAPILAALLAFGGNPNGSLACLASLASLASLAPLDLAPPVIALVRCISLYPLPITHYPLPTTHYFVYKHHVFVLLLRQLACEKLHVKSVSVTDMAMCGGCGV